MLVESHLSVRMTRAGTPCEPKIKGSCHIIVVERRPTLRPVFHSGGGQPISVIPSVDSGISALGLRHTFACKDEVTWFPADEQ